MARANIETEAIARIHKLAAFVNRSAREAFGTIGFLWSESQEILKTHGTLNEIADWAQLFSETPEQIEKWIASMIRARFLSKEGDLYLIHGNEVQIQGRVGKLHVSAKGGEATKAKWEKIKAAARLGEGLKPAEEPSDGTPPTTPDSPLEASFGHASTTHSLGTIQCSSVQPNAVQPSSDQTNPDQLKIIQGKPGKNPRVAKASVVSEFDLESLYEKYPLKEGKGEGLERLAKQIITKADFDSFSKAVDAYTKACVSKGTYFKHFSTFVGTGKKAKPWHDWLEENAGASLEVATTTRVFNRAEMRTQANRATAMAYAEKLRRESNEG